LLWLRRWRCRAGDGFRPRRTAKRRESGSAQTWRSASRNAGAAAAGEGADAVAAVLAPGEDGFIRATLRGLARERRRGDLGAEAPFRLASWPDGGLSLEDTATGRTLDLRAFGPTQAEAFARLLPKPGEGTR
jgi:putative photosynthetic complex assembly protein